MLPLKFLFKQKWASKDIRQKLTFPKETQAKRGLFTSQNFLTQWWSTSYLGYSAAFPGPNLNDGKGVLCTNKTESYKSYK